MKYWNGEKLKELREKKKKKQVPAGIYLFEVNNICSKLTIKTAEWCQTCFAIQVTWECCLGTYF